MDDEACELGGWNGPCDDGAALGRVDAFRHLPRDGWNRCCLDGRRCVRNREPYRGALTIRPEQLPGQEQ